MLFIIFILFPKEGHQFNFFFFLKNWDSIKQFTYIFINNKELIPYMFSVTTWVYTFIKRLQVVANLLTDIMPIYGAPC